MLSLVLALFIWFGQNHGWFASAQQSVQDNQPGLYRVARFSDGDTITVDMDGTEETVRFIGVDTPETHDPRKKVQCGGPAASAFTKNTITNAGLKVRLAADSLSSNRDRYDRLLRYVYLPDGTFMNLKLINDGYGFYYPYFPFSKSKDFDAAEQQAKSAHKGLWQNCTPTPTDGGGWVSNDL
jgi:micrococcal nuclease